MRWVTDDTLTGQLPAEDQMSVGESTTPAGRREGERPSRSISVVAGIEGVEHRHLEIHEISTIGRRVDRAHTANTTSPSDDPSRDGRTSERN